MPIVANIVLLNQLMLPPIQCASEHVRHANHAEVHYPMLRLINGPFERLYEYLHEGSDHGDGKDELRSSADSAFR